MTRSILRRLCVALICMLTLGALGAGTVRDGALAAPRQDATTPEVTVTVDRSRVTVGDPIALQVTVKHAPSVQILTTSIDEQLGDFDPLSSEPPEDRASGGSMELRLRYKIAAYQTGTVEVPVFTFDYALPDGTRQKVSSKAPLDITVQSVLPAGSQPSDIRPLKPQASLPGPASGWLVSAVAVIGGVVAAVAAVALAYLFIRRRRRPLLKPAPLASETARAELDRVMALGLLQKGELIEHYRLLAVCIRRYLTERYGFPAVALTTGELQKQMEAMGVERWPARLVTGLLSECDAVTYALYRPAPARYEADNAMAYEIIEETAGSVPIAARAG